MVSDFVFEIDVGVAGALTVAWITAGFGHITGYTVEDIRRPEMWADIVHSDDLAGLDRFMTAVAAGEQAELEYRIITRDGRHVWLSLRGRPRQADGRVTSILGAASDITARKEAEARIDEHSVPGAALDGARDHHRRRPRTGVLQDTANRFVRVNRCLADACGMAERELEGASLCELHDQEQAQAYHDDDLEVIRSGQAKLDIDEP